ncbi:MAG: hypothetical protein Kow0059_02220 [Candidatus Sumerlaeia bacterium]
MTAFTATSSPQGHAGTILIFFLLLLIGQSLGYPQQAYPLHGLVTNILMAVLTVLILSAGLYPAGRSGWLASGASLFFLFLAYVAVHNLAGHPAWHLSTIFPGTLVLGFWAYLAALTASQLDIHAFPPEGLNGGTQAGRSSSAASRHISIPRLTVSILIVFAAIMALYGVYQYFVQYEQGRRLISEGDILFASADIRAGVEHALKERRVAGTFGNPNLFAAFLTMALPGALALAVGGRRLLTRIAGMLSAALLMAGVFLSGSRGGLISYAAAVVLFAVLSRRAGPDMPTPYRSAVNSIISVLAAGMIVFMIAHAAASGAADAADEPSSSPITASLGDAGPPHSEHQYQRSLLERLFIPTTIQQRWHYWKIGWEIFRESPLTGRGEGMFAILYPQHRPPDTMETRYAHNFLVQLGAEEGLIGVFLYLLWLGSVSLAGYRHTRRCRHDRTRLSLAALLTTFIIFHFNSLFEYTFYCRELFIVMAASGGILWGYRRGKEAGEQPQGEPLTGPAASRITGTTGRHRRPIWMLRAMGGLSVAMAAWWIPRTMLVEHFVTWGDLLWADQNYYEAKEYYLRASRISPDHPDVLIRLAGVAGQEGKTAAEREYLMRALKVGNPLSPSLHSQMAMWHARRGEWTLALEWVDRALGLYPNSARYHYQRADILNHLGRTNDARRDRDLAMTLGAHDPAFQVFLQSLEGGKP